MRKHSIKSTRVNTEVMRELSKIMREDLKDPRVDAMSSITRCEVATDLKTCKVYISTLGDEKKQEDALEGLKRASGFLRKGLARGLNLRNTPELTFIADQSIEYGVRMSQEIDRVIREDQKNQGDTDEA